MSATSPRDGEHCDRPADVDDPFERVRVAREEVRHASRSSARPAGTGGRSPRSCRSRRARPRAVLRRERARPGVQPRAAGRAHTRRRTGSLRARGGAGPRAGSRRARRRPGRATSRDPFLARSSPYRDRGRSIAIHARRWPALHCAWRYGAIANASPPASDAPRGVPTSRSQSAVKPPAPRKPSRRKTFHASTVPSTAWSGQYTYPNGQPARFQRGLTSGWKLYGSRHGARPCSSWCPTSQRL